jgi:dTDP-4-amino-4,6-dideoxygalactose transaminase
MPPVAREGDLHAWHLFVVRLHEGFSLTREDFIKQMLEMGVGCSVHFIPLHLQPYWKSTYNLQENDFPVSLRIYRKAVSLPLYTKMTHHDQEKVILAVKKILCG